MFRHRSNETSAAVVVPKLMYVGRHVFVDARIEASENYSKQALCWYDIPMTKVDFSQVDSAVKEINDWAREQNEKALEAISFVKGEAKALIWRVHSFLN